MHYSNHNRNRYNTAFNGIAAMVIVLRAPVYMSIALLPSLPPLLLLLHVQARIVCIEAWQEWNYTNFNFATDDWRDIHGYANGPRGRQGHSMVVWNETNIVLFGGRDNDVHRPHVAKTYELVEEMEDENGTMTGTMTGTGVLKFQTYEDKPLLDHYDPDSSSCLPQKTCVKLKNATSGNEEACSYSWHHLLEENGNLNDNHDNDGDGNGNGNGNDFPRHDASESRYAYTSRRNQMEETCGFTTSGLYYNDVWVYNLNCRRFADLPCENDGWRVLHPGERYGGCRDDDDDDDDDDGTRSDEDKNVKEGGGIRKCNTPSERWGHNAAMIDASTMLVYGGYSQECEDYCNDVWAFDFTTMQWERWTIRDDDNDELEERNPGRRWKASMISTHPQQSGSANTNPNDSIIVLFGGHRLWHGFAMDNSEENLWNNVDTYPRGGYLNDLWTLERKSISFSQGEGEDANDTTTSSSDANPNPNHTQQQLTWKKHKPLESCVTNPGIAWEERNRVQCNVFWPRERSGHAVAYDAQRHRMWIHGGYSTHYPYPSSSSPGSGNGVKGQRAKGFTPFASSQTYFLDDLWFYGIDTGYWKEIRSSDSVYPTMRTDHLLIQFRDILILNGGYSNNKHFNDTWYYYIEENKWLEKTEHVHAHYPAECTDDIVEIENDEECIELSYPHPLKRAEEATYSVRFQEVLPFQQQSGYTPDPEYPIYFGIVDDAEAFVSDLRDKYQVNGVYSDDGNRIWLHSTVPDGTPIAPYAATAPRQFARKKRIEFNTSLTLDVWEWCISVQGEPTRYRTEKGHEKVARASATVRIPQPRRQTAGWDGCRELRWIHPPSRSGHKGVLVEKFSQFIIYGGLSYLNTDHVTGIHPFTDSLNETHETIVVDDMWQYGIDNCPRNCSNHGLCTNGFCKCEPGFYGLDCSNVTCPGSTCYYDDDRIQHCKHCCFDGFHHDEEGYSYIAGIAKTTCNPLEHGGFTGHSNGICDGFGTCQCAPSFLGEDCSIRDCPDNCNDNGYCSLEFPIARCICNEGYKGNACQYIECMNNCSFPNGECDYSTGSCKCTPIYSPYNKSQIWSHWQGEDCSFLTPWCGSFHIQVKVSVLILVSSTILAILLG